MQYKTPGVYLQDLTPPRPNVPALETAVPAWIGYTQKALDEAGASLHLLPTRIRNMEEFGRLFGGPFEPERYRIVLDTAKDNAVLNVEAMDRYYLYDCLLHYFGNGGGPCYIVSIGSYAEGLQVPAIVPPPPADECEAAPASGGAAGGSPAAATPEWARFQQGIDALLRFDDPTLLLFPDTVRMRKATDGSPDTGSMGIVQQYALLHCARLMDRFAILDLMPVERLHESAAAFREAVGQQNLSYGAAYYPWLFTNYSHSFHLDALAFYDTGGAPLPAEALSSGIGAAAAAQHRSLMAAAMAANEQTNRLCSAARLPKAEAAHLLSYLDDLRRIFLREAGEAPAQDALDSFRNLCDTLRGIALCFALNDQKLPGALQNALDDALPSFNLPNSIRALLAIETSPKGLIRYGADTALRGADIALLDGTRWIGGQSAAGITPGAMQTDAELHDAVLQVMLSLGRGFMQLWLSASAARDASEALLFSTHPVLQKVAEAIGLEMKRIPPSGAVAGVYVATDAERGVWKAPANVSLRETLGPVLAIDDRMQESLNVHESGKAINAIRTFPGRGAVLWGSRTLLANSLEWRYVPVRRLFIYAEEFVKKATEAFVFEANDANTWTQLRMMIDLFLRALWRQGALVGNTAEEAFFVRVGLGETMTAQDILEGRLIVDVGLAAARPAEFILIRYACRMEES